jgi:hypothetical protein
VNPRCMVIRLKDEAVLAQFASRYAAMVLAERLTESEGPHRVVSQIAT